MNSKHPMVLIVGIVCALAVCSARTAYAQAPSDPCTLLTQAQVSAVLGVTVSPGQPISTTGCEWSPQQPSSFNARVTVSLWDAQAFAGMKTPLPGVTKTPVSGVGDEAVYATIAGLTTLSVKKGKVAFVVRIYGVPGQAKQMAMEKSLALDILAKL
jgi:hypothetical protein